jgi:4-oxalocrotonate tautomerase family enzyme
MPLVKVEIQSGKSKEYKKTLMNAIHNVLVECIKIPDHDCRQRLYELDEENFQHTGRSDAYTIIEITMFKGRSFEAKKALYAGIAAKLENELGISGNDITIVIHEPELQNWGIRGGKPASEVDLGFNINI